MHSEWIPSSLHGCDLIFTHASNLTACHSPINSQQLSTHFQSLKNTVLCSLCLNDPSQTIYGLFLSCQFHCYWKCLWLPAWTGLFSCPAPYFPFHSSCFNCPSGSWVRFSHFCILHNLWFSRRRVTAAAAAAKSLQSCPTLCDPIDGSPPGPAVPGILQARTLEWVAISSSNAWKWKVTVKSLSHVRLLVTPWTAAYQAPPSMGFSRQEHWSGLPH